ncbi:MAG: DNA-processing protein DprA [Patescibacteria group bacterium]|nr:DNA-processing protein DprA [Patescibacteria group bacterium]
MKKYWAAFASIEGIRSSHWQKIIGFFPNLKDAWQGSFSEFKKAGLKDDWVESFFLKKKNTNPDLIFDNLTKNKIDILLITDKEYPTLLKEIHNPPYVLYIKGKIYPKDEISISIVGSRKGTDYGKRATFEISKELAQNKITIISGLALGLDTEAHRGALSATGGRTVAVLANGLDQIYPSTNFGLASKITENGCLISEQPIGMPALKQNFPARNRIISGLSQGVLVTEAGEHSGTLHTASFAIEQNRQIYAIPGPIYNPLAKGPNNLIKQGAKPVTEATDILEDFGIENNLNIAKPENDDERIIFEILKEENLHIDEITRKTKRDSKEISKILTMMEIKNKIRHLGGMVYGLK